MNIFPIYLQEGYVKKLIKSGALDFWKKYKLVVLGLAEVRKNMEEES